MKWVVLLVLMSLGYLAGFNSGTNRGFDTGVSNKQTEVDALTAQLDKCYSNLAKAEIEKSKSCNLKHRK